MSFSTLPPLLKCLDILSLIDAGEEKIEAAKKSNVHLSAVENILRQRTILEERITPIKQRRNLTMADKLKIAHCIEKGQKIRTVCTRFNLDERVARRIGKSSTLIRDQVQNGAPINGKRPAKPKYLQIEEKTMMFVEFLRSQRLPVSLGIIQQRARMIANELGMTEFKASRGWVEKFVYRNGV